MFTTRQQVAITHHCRLAFETYHPRFKKLHNAGYSTILTVNSGYE